MSLVPTFCPIYWFGKIIDYYNSIMFFKKKKSMSDDIKVTHNNTDDNLAHNEEMDEALGNVLNTDDSAHGGNTLSEGNDEEVVKIQAELDEMKDKHLRMIAEFDNFRRRTAKERIEANQLAGKDIISSLLVVLDDMSRAEKQIEKASDVAAIKEGISLVFNKLRSILQSKGLKAMDAVNEEFNADLHEALTEIPAPNAKMKGKVIDMVEPGYYLNDKLIRHAKVVVGN